jgi:hypothetical protein
LLAWPGSAYWLRLSAAMACPSGRVGEQLERHADKHRFPMRIRPGDRPPVQRSANRPLNVELLQALEGRSGNWAPSGLLKASESSDDGLTVDHCRPHAS